MNIFSRISRAFKQLRMPSLGALKLSKMPSHLTIPEAQVARLRALGVTDISCVFQPSVGFPVQRTSWEQGSRDTFADPAMLNLSMGEVHVTLLADGNYGVRADKSFFQRISEAEFARVTEALLNAAEKARRIARSQMPQAQPA